MRYAIVFMALLVSGCQVLNQPDMPATLQAERIGYVAEATAIAQTATAEAGGVQVTALAAGTRIAQVQAVNQVLLATVRAGDPPEVRGVVANTIATPQGLQAGQRWFVKTGVGSAVRSSDGCVEDVRLRFETTVERLYATVKVFNIEAGVEMSVSWFHEGDLMWQERWTVNRSAGEMCIWFDLARENVDFLPGSWSVLMYADGFQLEDAMTFALDEPSGMMNAG